MYRTLQTCTWFTAFSALSLWNCMPERHHAQPLTDSDSITVASTIADTIRQDQTGPSEPPTIRIAMTGDIMPGTTFPDSIDGTYLPVENGKHLFEHVSPWLKEADAAFGNLETSFLDSGGNLKKCVDPQTYYVFRTPSSYAGLLAEAGFDAVSIANNHTNDLGEKGRRSTRHILDSIGIAYAGHTPLAKTTVFKKGETVFGFCAFSSSPLTPDLRDTAEVHGIISDLRSRCQILVVSFHGGNEGADFCHLPFCDEVYLGHNQGNVVEFARFCIDHGADIVFGHGPHLPRAMELYREHLIAYSLGNFCTAYRVSLKGTLGYAPLLVADLDKQGHFTGGYIHSFRQQRGRGPLPDSLYLAAKEIKRLTESDFPLTPLHISPDGHIEVVRK